jgi:Lrp/AsnC family leucine-responsive transcriptional regulator
MRRSKHINGRLDPIDVAILGALVEDARIPMKDLAVRVGLSAPSAAERVRRLEEAGVIEGYGARLNAQALGLPLAALIRVRPLPGQLARVARLLAAQPQVIECVRVTGDDCFVAKALIASVAELERLIDGLLPHATTNTSLIQSSPVAPRMPAVPLELRPVGTARR